MALEYLAMYIEVQFEMGATENPILPVRHFASSRPKLGEAVKSGELFTDLDAALREWDLIKSRSREISVLFDSTLPGRQNIIKGNAKSGLSAINKTLEERAAANAAIPAIRRPDVSGFTLFFGMKTSTTRFPRPIIDVIHWRNFFTKPGAYVEVTGPTFERNVVILPPNIFEAMTFRDWGNMFVDGP